MRYPDGGRLTGFVAEHIWHLLTTENALTYGLPVRVDGPDWSVTDSGGDGLVVYRPDGTLVFRLWESKAHTGDGAVRDVVNGACRQVDTKALRYLARFSKVGQSLDDPELQEFYGRLPELWRHAAREAGAGISVATASDGTSSVSPVVPDCPRPICLIIGTPLPTRAHACCDHNLGGLPGRPGRALSWPW